MHVVTVKAETVTIVDLRIDAYHRRNIRHLDKHLVEHLLSSIIELIAHHSPLHSHFVPNGLTDDIVHDSGEPPDTLVMRQFVPFLWYWLLAPIKDINLLDMDYYYKGYWCGHVQGDCYYYYRYFLNFDATLSRRDRVLRKVHGRLL